MTAALVKALGGRYGMARCPAHKDRTPSLSVSERDGKVLIHCHAGCSQEDVWQALKDRGLVGKYETSFRIRRRETVLHIKHPDPSEPDRRAAALAIWEASVPALHTPAQAYLQCRGIVIQPPACIRYHPGINALVALVQASDGSFSGIQRIYLATDSRGTWKRPIDKPKKSKGVIKAGAVRLTPAAEILQLCESVEDAMALLQMTGRPTWAVPGAGFMVSFEPPPTVLELVPSPDNDKAGHDVIEKAAPLLTGRRVRVRCLLPPANADWCDVLPLFEERAGIRQFDGAEDRAIADLAAFKEALNHGG
jgi:hypothetical protein